MSAATADARSRICAGAGPSGGIAAALSIVTVTRNNAGGLARTLASVRGQTDRPREVIVVDGHSTDETPAVLGRFADVVARAETDRGAGIYAAMNQGAAAASGAWVLFLNAGDELHDPGALARLPDDPDAELVHGDAFKADGSPHLAGQDFDRPWANMPFSHQALFCRRDLLAEHPFDVSLKIVADYEFVLWAFAGGRRRRYVPSAVCRVEPGGVSEAALTARVRESYRAARRYHFWNWRVHRHYFHKLRWAGAVEARRATAPAAPRGGGATA